MRQKEKDEWGRIEEGEGEKSEGEEGEKSEGEEEAEFISVGNFHTSFILFSASNSCILALSLPKQFIIAWSSQVTSTSFSSFLCSYISLYVNLLRTFMYYNRWSCKKGDVTLVMCFVWGA